MRRLVTVVVVLCLFGAADWYRHRPIAPRPGLLVADEPVQVPTASSASTRIGAFEIVPLADFALQARVLSRHDYQLGTESELSPTDLALGWGRMSDSAVIEQLDISQSARFFSYRWSQAPPIPPDEIVRSAANMHIIPADANVARALARVRQGQVIALRGHLVEARRADGWRWTSSLTREDSGAGSCELVLADSIEVQ